MSSLDTLAPDQRAVLELVLRQGRSYGELAELLEIPEREVRARADAGLHALAGEAPAGVDTGRIADWLLGQQREGDAERTRAAVARSEEARAWADAAAERLRELGEIAAESDRAVAAEPARPRSSKLGGAILIAVAALAVIGVLVLVLTLAGDDDDDPGQPAASTPTPTAEQAGNDIVLTGRGGAEGLMRLFRTEEGTVQFAIAAQNVRRQRSNESYAVWFTRANGEARRLGFTQVPVGEDGILTTGGPQQGDQDRFPRWFATYDKVLVTRETASNPRRPGPVLLEGTLPGA
jgi:hypothetical protein